jgi:hypothetical protein
MTDSEDSTVTDLGTVDVPWPAEDGPWTLACRLSLVDGRAEVTGLAVHGDGQTPIDATLWRSIRIGAVAEQARIRLAARLGASGELARMIPTRPRPIQGVALVALAAAYYPAAEFTDPRRTSRLVAEWIRQDGRDVTDGQVRTALSRARSKGMLPPLNRTEEDS